MNAITIDRNYREKGPAPLYFQYERQCNAQPAYLEMDEHGMVSVDYTGEIGYAVPGYVWHRRTLRWTIPNNLSVAGIDQLLDDVGIDLQQIHDGHTVEWDGNNDVGRLSETAQDISTGLDQRLHECEDYDRAEIWDAAEWLQSAWDETVAEYQAAENKGAYLEHLAGVALSDGIHLVGMDALERALQGEPTRAGARGDHD